MLTKQSAVRVPEDAVGHDYLSTMQEREDKEDYSALTRLCGIAKEASIVRPPSLTYTTSSIDLCLTTVDMLTVSTCP